MTHLHGGRPPDHDAEAELRHDLSALCGLPCLGVVAEASVSTAVTLHLGRALHLREPLTDERLPEFLRAHEGEYLLFVACAWRLDTATAVVCGSQHGDTVTPETIAGLARLTGAIVVDVRTTGPAHDLALEFEDGLTFRVFCDRAQAGDAANYSLFTQTTCYQVAAAGALSMKPIE